MHNRSGSLTNTHHKWRKSAHNGYKAREHDSFPAIFLVELFGFDEVFALEKPRVCVFEGGKGISTMSECMCTRTKLSTKHIVLKDARACVCVCARARAGARYRF